MRLAFAVRLEAMVTPAVLICFYVLVELSSLLCVVWACASSSKGRGRKRTGRRGGACWLLCLGRSAATVSLCVLLPASVMAYTAIGLVRGMGGEWEVNAR